MRKGLLLAAAAFGAMLTAGQAGAAGKPEIGDAGIELTSINHDLKPGDDFWGYVNGGWQKGQTIPSDRSHRARSRRPA